MTDIIDTIDAATEGLCACGCGAALDPNGPSAWYAGQACQHRWAQQHASNPGDVYQRRDAATYPPDVARWTPQALLGRDEPQVGDPHPRRAGYTYQPWMDASSLPVDDPLHYPGRLLDPSRLLLPRYRGEVRIGWELDRWTVRLSDDTRTVDTTVDCESLWRYGVFAGQRAWCRLEAMLAEMAAPVNHEMWWQWREADRIAAQVMSAGEFRRLIRIAGTA